MARYFFHLQHGSKHIGDPEGWECIDAEAARLRALRIVREMLAEDLRQGRVELGWRLRLEDASGGLIHTLNFGDVLSGRETEMSHRMPPIRC